MGLLQVFPVQTNKMFRTVFTPNHSVPLNEEKTPLGQLASTGLCSRWPIPPFVSFSSISTLLKGRSWIKLENYSIFKQ